MSEHIRLFNKYNRVYNGYNAYVNFSNNIFDRTGILNWSCGSLPLLYNQCPNWTIINTFKACSVPRIISVVRVVVEYEPLASVVVALTNPMGIWSIYERNYMSRRYEDMLTGLLLFMTGI